MDAIFKTAPSVEKAVLDLFALRATSIVILQSSKAQRRQCFIRTTVINNMRQSYKKPRRFAESIPFRV